MNNTKHPHELSKLKQQALLLMKNAGFALKHDVTVEVDPDLGFMGYTTERGGETVIVVAGFALESGAALNLLIHEMSHVYRSQTGHPSHDYHLLTTMAAWVMHGKAVHGYQERILKNILNILQDLYADDISFKVFKITTPNATLNEFFLSWIHKPVRATSAENRWTNAEYLLDAAFAKANLERHNIPDTRGKVEKATQEFLSNLDSKLSEKYDFFRKFMVNLPEEVTKKDFEKLLVHYLGEFLKLTSPV